jgi:hypothetical protein
MSQNESGTTNLAPVDLGKVDRGVRRLPQYITDQLLQAIDTVRQGRMRKSELEFEQCTIIVAKIGQSVQVLITERTQE